MAKNTEATIDPTLVEIGIYEMLLVKEQIDSLKGTQAQRVAKAWDAMSETQTGGYYPFTGGTLAELMDYAEDVTAHAQQAKDEAIKEWLVKNKDQHATSVDALKVTFHELSDRVSAFAKVLVDLGKLEELPTLPKLSAGGRPAGSGGAKIKNYQYSVTTAKGTWEPTASQNSLSSVAFYKGSALMGTDDKVTTAALKAAITAAGVDPDAATDWAVDLPGGSIKFTVLEQTEG